MKELPEHMIASTSLIEMARNNVESPTGLVYAMLAVAYSNLATLDYIMERDSKPYDDARMMLDLGMELGLKRAKQESKNGE